MEINAMKSNRVQRNGATKLPSPQAKIQLPPVPTEFKIVRLCKYPVDSPALKMPPQLSLYDHKQVLYHLRDFLASSPGKRVRMLRRIRFIMKFIQWTTISGIGDEFLREISSYSTEARTSLVARLRFLSDSLPRLNTTNRSKQRALISSFFAPASADN
jgi:hypothetical protein